MKTQGYAHHTLGQSTRAKGSTRLTWAAVLWFGVIALVIPSGVTIEWRDYFIVATPGVLLSVSATVFFVLAKQRHETVSGFSGLAPIVVLCGIWIITWYGARLRW